MLTERYASLTFFHGLTDQDLQSIFPYFCSSAFVGGTTIFKQGDKADYFYLLVSGEIILRYKPDDGPVMTVTKIQPGGVFGWSAAIGNSTYTSSAVCSLNSEVLMIPGETLRIICKDNPTVGDILLKRLSMVIAERKQITTGQISTILNDNIGPKVSGGS